MKRISRRGRTTWKPMLIRVSNGRKCQKIFSHWRLKHILVSPWQNLHKDLCNQWRLRSSCTSIHNGSDSFSPSLDSPDAAIGTSDQRRLWLECADALANLNLRRLHMSYCRCLFCAGSNTKIHGKWYRHEVQPFGGTKRRRHIDIGLPVWITSKWFVIPSQEFWHLIKVGASTCLNIRTSNARCQCVQIFRVNTI